jgi:glycosyltransferase involved in cell wall biosynthesis
MHIAQIAPLYEAVPPRLYGGTERVVASLCDALVDLGHDVTLFASAESRTKAKLVAARAHAIRLDPDPLKSDVAAHLSMLQEVKHRARHFEVLHFHIDLLHLPMFEQDAHRTVTTLHGRQDLQDLQKAYAQWPAFGLVSISDYQRTPVPFANWLGTVPHGLPPAAFQLSETPAGDCPGGYLAFIGRISPEKRAEVAIAIAQRARIPLKIAAKVDAVDREYYESTVRPLLDDPLIDFIGEIDEDQKSAFLGNARALLFPIDWPEPFGLVMIEAMACGTPVIAFKNGSVPEVIDDGVTGFIVRSIEQAVAAVEGLGEIDRETVRATFEQRFTAERMAHDYLNIYRSLPGARLGAARLRRLKGDDLEIRAVA